MKFGKRFISLALALVMVFGLTTGASAATVENIKVQLSPNITVKLDGEAQTMADVNGNPVYPVLNGGTTYLPVRAVSGMLGIGVDWDGATQTVLLDTSKKTTPTKTDGKTPANAKPSEITVQLSPNITVKLDGKAQSMTDVNGNPVYPLLYDGTTYLPIRAVANMLGLNVGWDGATQTVYLAQPRSSDSPVHAAEAGTVTYTVTFENPTVERIRKSMERFKYSEEAIEAAIAEFVATGPNGENGTFIYDVVLNKKDTFKTSDGAIVLGDKHLACDYAEVDYSMADDGYIQVKLTEQVTEPVGCVILWENETGAGLGFPLKLDKWVNIPLLYGSGDYQLTISPSYSTTEYLEQLSGTFSKPYYENFFVAVTADIENPDAWTLRSNARVDFENALKTVAKASELTKNCKTDAEKITAIFEFVAKTIKYDYTDRDFDLDKILDSKTGVCEHYAILMAGMLRSEGIPCKVVSGKAYNGKEWVNHAWVSVSPDTKGLNLSRLGAGHDEDGWIRLDPTWGNNAADRSAAVDKNHKTDYAY